MGRVLCLCGNSVRDENDGRLLSFNDLDKINIKVENYIKDQLKIKSDSPQKIAKIVSGIHDVHFTLHITQCPSCLRFLIDDKDGVTTLKFEDDAKARKII